MSSTEFEATSTIREVTVYENRAQVQRHSIISVVKGENKIIFSDLPSSIDKDSLQVGFVAEKGDDTASHIVLRGIVFDQISMPNPEFDSVSSERQESSAKVTSLRRQLRDVTDQLEHLRKEQQLSCLAFQRATSTASGVSDAVFDPSTWTTVIDAYTSRSESQLSRQRQLEGEMQTLSELVRTAEATSRVHVPRRITKSVVAVVLAAKEDAVKVTLTISYLVENASWQSEYEIRVNSDALELKVGYNAIIKQRTEEDWKDARVTLSTARPSLSGKQPELEPWRVDIKKPVIEYEFEKKCDKGKKKCKGAVQSSARRSRNRDESDSDEEDGCLADYEAPVVETATVSEAATSVSFVVPRPLTVLRDGEETRASLLALDFVATLHHVVVPSQREAAYASAKAKNTSDIPLGAGKASIFLDGQYVASSDVPRTNPGEELEVPVGVDEGVSVKHKLLNKKRTDESGGVFSATKDLLTYRYLTKLKNTKKTNVTVKIRGSVPVSDNEELVVTLVEPSLGSLSDEGKRKVAEDGVVESCAQLKPNEDLEHYFSFTICSPQGQTIYGL